MKEHLNFTKTQFKNGITTYSQLADQVDFTSLVLIIPVGNAHNTNEILPGTFHLLEHTCLTHSKMFPLRDSFFKEVGQLGGSCNARTSAFSTQYELSLPNIHLEKMLPGLYSAVFEPIFEYENIEVERSIIRNERQDRRWYPGSNESSHYLSTKWQNDVWYPLEQIFGSDTDLQEITPAKLTQAHRNYFNPGIVLVSIGSADLSGLSSKLEQLETTSSASLPYSYHVIEWQNQQYHEQSLYDVNQYNLWYGGLITPAPDRITCRRIGFILDYLFNSMTGPISHWLRHDLGVYSTRNYSTHDLPHSYDWSVKIPLHSHEQVASVRNQIFSKISEALTNAKAIEQEVKRLMGRSVYWYEDVDSRLESAVEDIYAYGEIFNESQWREAILACNDPGALQEVYAQYFTSDQIGSVLLYPKD